MPTENQKPEMKQTVQLEGYLKENTLERGTKDGLEYIKGRLTIAHDANSDFRIDFFANKYAKTDTAHTKVLSSYSALENLLPDKTSTLAALFKAFPSGTFDVLKEQATKVWATGQFDLYDRKTVKDEIITMVKIKGFSAGVKTAMSKTPFTCKAEFDVEAYVDGIHDEVEEGKGATGRTIVDLCLVDYYKKETIPLQFICATPSAKAQIGLYSVGKFGRFVGNLINSREETVMPGEVTTWADNSTSDSSRTITTFISERHMVKMTYPYTPNDAKVFTADEIKAMKTTREARLQSMPVTPDKPVGGANGGGNFIDSTGGAAPSVANFQL